MSRYYDYDADNNCIIGFGADDEDLAVPDYLHRSSPVHSSRSEDSSPLSSRCSSSVSLKTVAEQPQHQQQSSNSDLHQAGVDTSGGAGYSCDAVDEFGKDELDHDANTTYILPAANTANLIPVQLDDTPFLLVSDMLKQQSYRRKLRKLAAAASKITNGDVFSRSVSDQEVEISRDHNHLYPDLVFTELRRAHALNGSYTNAYGKRLVKRGDLHVWRFQVFGYSPSIIGIVECDLQTNKLKGGYFGSDESKSSYAFNTVTAECYSCHSGVKKQPVYQQLLQCGRLDDTMIIDIKVDMTNGRLSMQNVTANSEHFLKEILLFDSIDVTKQYRLAIALLGKDVLRLL